MCECVLIHGSAGKMCTGACGCRCPCPYELRARTAVSLPVHVRECAELFGCVLVCVRAQCAEMCVLLCVHTHGMRRWLCPCVCMHECAWMCEPLNGRAFLYACARMCACPCPHVGMHERSRGGVAACVLVHEEARMCVHSSVPRACVCTSVYSWIRVRASACTHVSMSLCAHGNVSVQRCVCTHNAQSCVPCVCAHT